jgi:hypothetical protein
MQFEYLVCQTQFSRVTFVNGEWQGTVPLDSGDSQAALDSGPQIWDSQSGRQCRLAIDHRRPRDDHQRRSDVADFIPALHAA